MLGLSPGNTLDRGQSRAPCAVLWLPTAPQRLVKCRDQISLYAVYVTNTGGTLPYSCFFETWFYLPN